MIREPIVVTVTPNPSLDRTIRVDSVRAGAVHRVASASIEPSGKGVNVAVALCAAGRPAVAVLPVAGSNGALLTSMLDALALRYRAVPAHGEIRTNISITEADGTTTKFNEPGLDVSATDFNALTDAARLATRAGDWIAWCGSLPSSVDVSWLTNAIAAERSAGRLVALDTSDAALAAVLDGPDYALPHLIKPNAEELATLVGRPLRDIAAVADAAASIVHRGVDTVLVSLGADGAILVDQQGVLVGQGPRVDVVNTAGAGDAFLAGYLATPSAGREQRLASALQFGASAVQHTGTLMTDLSLRHDVRVHPWTPTEPLSTQLGVFSDE